MDGFVGMNQVVAQSSATLSCRLFKMRHPDGCCNFASLGNRRTNQVRNQKNKGNLKQVIGISAAACSSQMSTFKLSERLPPSSDEKLTTQKQRLSASYHCSRCGSVRLKIVFKARDAKTHPFFQCQECQMEDRIS
jgi:DNA-directed RNA polymerase subunit RPC12/RpoP